MKFVILHHSPCSAAAFHYHIDSLGAVTPQLPETTRGAHAASIGVLLHGDFDTAAPTSEQLAALRTLLLRITLRYPGIELGGHRQIRGAKTRCPGKLFPLADLRTWAATTLIEERDAVLQEEIERQYRG